GEFRMWAEFDRISPIGDIRGDILNGQLVSAMYGAQGGKVTIEDAQLKWSTEEDEVIDSGDPFAGLEAALLAASE
ncbi:TPA: phage tail assembly protein T, partial [Klebsiella michiganensis]